MRMEESGGERRRGTYREAGSRADARGLSWRDGRWAALKFYLMIELSSDFQDVSGKRITSRVSFH